MRADDFPAPIFRPGKRDKRLKSGLVLRRFVPLQAADLYAGEVFRVNRDKLPDSSAPIYSDIGKIVPEGAPKKWTTEETGKLLDVLENYEWWHRFSEFL